MVTEPLTNKAYGFPTRGAPRRVKAPILACIHITGNRRTAANPDRHQAARDERNYANRPGSNGPSAHYYVARDGWTIEAVDPTKYAAWSNGDVASPNTANAGIAKVLDRRAKATTPTRRTGSSSSASATARPTPSPRRRSSSAPPGSRRLPRRRGCPSTARPSTATVTSTASTGRPAPARERDVRRSSAMSSRGRTRSCTRPSRP